MLSPTCVERHSGDHRKVQNKQKALVRKKYSLHSNHMALTVNKAVMQQPGNRTTVPGGTLTHSQTSPTQQLYSL